MSMADDYRNEYNPDDYYGRSEGYVDYAAELNKLVEVLGWDEIKKAIETKLKENQMQLAQVPVDGQKYDVVAQITNLGIGKPVGQKGFILQKFDLTDASKNITGVGYFYNGNQPDMALPMSWNGQTMPISVSAKANGEYTNYTVSIPRGGATFAGQGNPAAAAPIQQAMAANNVQYANQAPQQAPPQQPYSPPSQAPQGHGRERNINLQSARKDAIAFLSASQAEHITEEAVKACAERFADWAMGIEMMPPTF